MCTVLVQVSRVPYVELVSLPTWHSRTSSWNLRLKVPEASSVVDGGSQKQTRRSQFLTNVVIKDGQISLRGQSSATVVASFTGDAAEPYSVNAYSCDLEDFPMFILHQVIFVSLPLLSVKLNLLDLVEFSIE